MSYKIRLELFEGPLDLLLYLVKKEHLTIYDIPIARVTEQYLQYLELMRFLDLNIAGEFLVMAATLMQIKSKMLLPAQENEAVEEDQGDPRAELIRQLLEYQKFKEVAQDLQQRESREKEIFKRPKVEEPVVQTEQPAYFEASIFDLLTAFSKVLEEVPKELLYEVIKDEFTIEGKVHEILHLLLDKTAVRISELFQNAKNKLEIIVTFLAILELIRLKEIVVVQREVFGEIEIARNEANIIPYDKRSQTEYPQAQK
ncbi:MAG: chromosome segregation protein ScpA [Candidatus Omnitrophota bacterium]|jgi:segregation and condensation protein A|nr:MAG: chromosome segregation protein ScpA [Candidatus Omnitrophota bacterium]